jgi:hypothetical protein
MSPYLLPLDHPVKPSLDALFSASRVTENEASLLQAGFQIIASMPGSFVIVARHPSVPGYIFKLYLDSEKRHKEETPNCEWLARRCIGAKMIRNLITKKKLSHFTVPDKWLYVLPIPEKAIPDLQPVIVVATDMELVEDAESERAWATLITTEHLDELYTILKKGYGSIRVCANIPYTKKGTFAFIDTEYPVRLLKLKRVTRYLPEEMQPYWERITHTKHPRPGHRNARGMKTTQS